MGMNQSFKTSANWDQAIDFLDTSFPLNEGSHGSAKAYLVYFDHLLVIQADGSSTGLSYPSQFIEAGGNEEAPRSILLEHKGIQVEIEPAQLCSDQANERPVHRMQLLTQMESV